MLYTTCAIFKISFATKSIHISCLIPWAVAKIAMLFTVSRLLPGCTKEMLISDCRALLVVSRVCIIHSCHTLLTCMLVSQDFCILVKQRPKVSRSMTIPKSLLEPTLLFNTKIEVNQCLYILNASLKSVLLTVHSPYSREPALTNQVRIDEICAASVRMDETHKSNQ